MDYSSYRNHNLCVVLWSSSEKCTIWIPEALENNGKNRRLVQVSCFLKGNILLLVIWRNTDSSRLDREANDLIVTITASVSWHGLEKSAAFPSIHIPKEYISRQRGKCNETQAQHRLNHECSAPVQGRKVSIVVRCDGRPGAFQSPSASVCTSW